MSGFTPEPQSAERMLHDIRFLLACIDMCDEADAPPKELDALDLAILVDIRRDYPAIEEPAAKARGQS